MSNRFFSNHFVGELNKSSNSNSPENTADRPSSAMAKAPKIASKLRRGLIGKKVISVPVKDMERLRLKGDHVSAPPSDSWAWRKYGQKPIKGSPYPRGYYRCSSSKACPARKQVERSRADPNMLVVTYSCDHSHPPPSSRSIHHRVPQPSAAAANLVSDEELEEDEDEEDEEDAKEKHRITQPQEFLYENRFCLDAAAVHGGDFDWLTEFESAPSVILESPVLMEERSSAEREMAMIFSAEESDLFAGLGELPECSKVFRRGAAEERRRSMGAA